MVDKEYKEHQNSRLKWFEYDIIKKIISVDRELLLNEGWDGSQKEADGGTEKEEVCSRNKHQQKVGRKPQAAGEPE